MRKFPLRRAWYAAAVGVVILAAGCGLGPPAATPAAAPTHAHAEAPRAATKQRPVRIGPPTIQTVTTPPVASTPASPTGRGYLGASVQNPPGDWTVTGCELVNVLPNGPAASAGLVGRDNRTDPVGDVIAAVSSAHTAMQPVTNCSKLMSFLSETTPGESITLNYWHRQVFIFGHWVARQVTLTLSSSPNSGMCPPPIRGTITQLAAGNRINLTIRLAGPDGASTVHAILDTGADVTVLPNRLLKSAGYVAYATSGLSGVVPGASTMDYLYSLPAGSLKIDDQGTWVPITDGTLQPVAGLPSSSGSATDRLIGPDVLKLGASLVVSGRHWTLTPPCSG